MIEIKHPFGDRSHDIIDLFSKPCKSLKFSSFMNSLEKQAILDEDNYSRDDYVGDAFEFFVEYLIKSHELTNVIGISEYEPILVDDTGVDGVGRNIDGDRCAIQVKYRNNTDTLLTSNNDHLSNMFSSNSGARKLEDSKEELQSLLDRGIINNKKYLREKKRLDNCAKRYYIFTTAKSLHYFTDEVMFNNEVHTFGIYEIKKFVDGNKPFWDNLMLNITNLYSKSKV